MTPEHEVAALDLLNKTLHLMYKEYQASCPFTELADGLSDRLTRLGVFTGDSGLDILVQASSNLVDKMPKAGWYLTMCCCEHMQCCHAVG